MTDTEELERLARAAEVATENLQPDMIGLEDYLDATHKLGKMPKAILSLLEEHKALRAAATAAYEDYCNNGHYVSAETGYILGCALGLHDDPPSQALGDKPEGEEYTAEQRMSDQQDAYRKWAGNSHD